jgi:uncharacterized protein YidB (DUF937 family)
MGLLDVLNGMQHGPRGVRDPSQKSGGMSPITMAILGLLAYKALKHVTGGQQTTAPAGSPPVPGGTTTASTGGLGGMLGGLLGGGSGGLGDLLKGGLGGALAGGAAGSVLSGGLGDLLGQLQKNGLGNEASSWVSKEPNKSVSPDDLGKALGADQINALSAQTGMSRDDLLSSLAQYLPDAVNHLTPDGRLPSEHELTKLL